jgi:hypothetical protein
MHMLVPGALPAGDEEVGHPGELGKAQHAAVLLPDPCRHLSAHTSDYNMSNPPLILMHM